MSIQTFLPASNFVLSASYLDARRLGQQRREAAQLLAALADPKNGWHKHPAAKMWRGYQDALVAYGLAMCGEWLSRGYDDSTYSRILSYKTVSFVPTQETVPVPWWLGREPFHAAHRGNLIRKDPKWYGAFGWTDSPLLPYIWPVP